MLKPLMTLIPNNVLLKKNMYILRDVDLLHIAAILHAQTQVSKLLVR